MLLLHFYHEQVICQLLLRSIKIGFKTLFLSLVEPNLACKITVAILPLFYILHCIFKISNFFIDLYR